MAADGRAFQLAAKRWNRFEEFNGHAFAALNEISRRIVQSEISTSEEKLGKLETIKNCALDISKVGAEAKVRAEGSQRLAALTNRIVDEEGDIDEIRNEFKRSVNQAAELAGQSASSDGNPDLQQVLNLIASLSNKDDADADIQEDFTHTVLRDTRCPVTGAALKQPLKNSNCQHVYSTEGVLQLLFQRNKTAGARMPQMLTDVPLNWSSNCPVVGCTSVMKRALLKRDYQMELTQRQMQTTASLRRESMEVDML